MDTYDETIQRIERAYLSGKNVDSVYENLLYELGNENIDASTYSPQFLRNYMRQMMVYLCHQFKPKLKSENFVTDPKKTIILLNAVAIRKVLQQIKEQIESLPKVGITPFPDIPGSFFERTGNEREARIQQQQIRHRLQPQTPMSPVHVQDLRMPIGHQFPAHFPLPAICASRSLPVCSKNEPGISNEATRYYDQSTLANNSDMFSAARQLPPQIVYQHGFPFSSRQMALPFQQQPMPMTRPMQPMQFTQPFVTRQPTFQTQQPVFQMQPQQENLSTPVDYLLPKKKKKKDAVSIKRLDKYISKSGVNQHQWWLQAKEEQKKQRAAAVEEVSEVQSSLQDPLLQQVQPNPCCNPYNVYNLVTINSADRDVATFSETCQYTLPICLDNVVSIYLYSVDIPVEGKVIDTNNNLLYYSEDDDPMKIITLPDPDESYESFRDSTQYGFVPVSQGRTDIQEYLQCIADEMTKRSNRYLYRVTLNRHTNRIRIVQILESGQAKNILHLFFEQTRSNCAQLLGFENKDYRDLSEYESTHEHTFHRLDKHVHMMIKEISPHPVLTLKIGIGCQRKQQQFPHSCIWNDEEEPLSTKQLSVSFVDDEGNPTWLSDKDHSIVIKYYYLPPMRTPLKMTDRCEENDPSLIGQENLEIIEKWKRSPSETQQEQNLDYPLPLQPPQPPQPPQVHLPLQQPQHLQHHIQVSRGTTDWEEPSVESERTCGTWEPMPQPKHPNTSWVPQKKKNRLPTLDV